MSTALKPATPTEVLPPDMARAGAVTPMDMLERAFQSGASLEQLDKLMALQERWERNQARKSFDAAMAAAKAEIPVIKKNREVDFTSQKGRTHYRHEDLAEVARTVNPILAKHGLSYRFKTGQDGQTVMVTCVISHSAGHSEENTLSAARDDSGNKNSIQGVGSTLTYLQRMTLKAALGLAASDDDDGQASGGNDTIDDDEAQALRDMIAAVGADEPRFLKYMGVADITLIRAKDYERAVTALQKKAGGK